MSVVQFNLLPDVKLEFNRNQRVKRLVYSLSFLVGRRRAGVVYDQLFDRSDCCRRNYSMTPTSNIHNYSNQLKSIGDLAKILTIQNQLKSLPSLHQSKHIASRLFDLSAAGNAH